MSTWGSPSGRNDAWNPKEVIVPPDAYDTSVGWKHGHHGRISRAHRRRRGSSTAADRGSRRPDTSSRSFSRVSGSVEYTIVPTMPLVSSTLYVLRMRRSTSVSGVDFLNTGSLEAVRSVIQRSPRQTRSGPMMTPDQSYSNPWAV